MNGKSFLLILMLLSHSPYAFNRNAMVNTDGHVRESSHQNNKMKIKIGSKTFTATLNDSGASKAFKAMLPLTLKMDDINGNEKKYDFQKGLPGNPRKPGSVNVGDLMLWSGNTLVLFYKSFSTHYSYVQLGRIDDPSGLEDALGAGDVTITYEL